MLFYSKESCLSKNSNNTNTFWPAFDQVLARKHAIWILFLVKKKTWKCMDTWGCAFLCLDQNLLSTDQFAIESTYSWAISLPRKLVCEFGKVQATGRHCSLNLNETVFLFKIFASIPVFLEKVSITTPPCLHWSIVYRLVFFYSWCY